MSRRSRSSLCFVLALLAVGVVRAQADTQPMPGQSDGERGGLKPKTPTSDDFGLNAPLVSVDRFSDAAGTLFRRSADPSLPAPGAAFSFDDPRFVVPVTGPGGLRGVCYNLDARPARPHRYYVFYDTIGNYRIGQFPVIDTVPGDPGYSDIWDIWKVVTPNSFREPHWLRSAAEVEKLIADPSSGYVARSTGIFLNGPIVPEGTTASRKGEGRAGSATTLYAWYNGKRAPLLYLEGRFHLDADGTVPVGKAIAAEAADSPARVSLSRESWPKSPGYTPLVTAVTVAGRPRLPGTVNCPIVGSDNP